MDPDNSQQSQNFLYGGHPIENMLSQVILNINNGNMDAKEASNLMNVVDQAFIEEQSSYAEDKQDEDANFNFCHMLDEEITP